MTGPQQHQRSTTSDPHCRLLDRFLADELSEIDQQSFARHLAGCDECRREIELDRAMDQWLQEGNTRTEVPPDLLPGIQAQLQTSSRRWLVAKATAALAIAATLAVVVGLSVVNRDSDRLVQSINDEPQPTVAQANPTNEVQQPDPVRTSGAVDDVVVRGGKGYIAAADTVDEEEFVLYWVLPSQSPSSQSPSSQSPSSQSPSSESSPSNDESSLRGRYHPFAESAITNHSANLHEI